MNLRDEILEYLNYDPETGIFRWIKSPQHRAQIGSIAGFINSHGYRVISFKTKKYKAHQLAFLIIYGHIPKNIDHINKNRSDNSIKNLRSISKSENNKNSNKKLGGKNKITGVYFHKITQKWLVGINASINKQMYLGLYKDFTEAVYTRWIAENIFGYTDIHGR